MGLFDFFMSDEQKINKHQRTLTDKAQQAEEREASARWLLQNGKPVSLLALLSRFEMRLEHQLNDQNEKELVYGMIAGQGDAAIEPLRAHLKRARQMAIPLRLLAEMRGTEEAVNAAIELLELERKKDDFKPEKKMQILVWLAEGRHVRAAPVAEHFLDDFDEGVRYSAAEVLIASGEEPARRALERALANPKEESTRVARRIADIFSGRGWRLEHPDAMAAHCPPGFAVRGDRLVSA